MEAARKRQVDDIVLWLARQRAPQAPRDALDELGDPGVGVNLCSDTFLLRIQNIRLREAAPFGNEVIVRSSNDIFFSERPIS